LLINSIDHSTAIKEIMTSICKFLRLLCCTVCALILSACVAAPPAIEKVATIDQVMAQASQASAAGKSDVALTLLKDASVIFPADTAPWLRMAQIKYEAGQYGAAIIDSQQALVRDPSNKVANSIVAVSGLRLSTRALSDLSRQNNLSASLRVESQDLAKLLRESLGDAVLVSRDRPAARRSARKPVSVPVPDSSAHPFDALK
jgi:tetratricopeptide (TPR) repeat protein